LLQQVNPASFPFLFSKSQRMLSFCQSFSVWIGASILCFLIHSNLRSILFFGGDYALFCGSVFRSDCAIGMRHCFSCTFF
jgi:hypothetical protein